ncbi:hypothetical protein B9Z55_023160 [Caenorhabditis nigoni]|uniref:Uncharacterized protein n=1 Tax=Caenorhabditis nigoni TaxID=1611254 RepID=A0A2G5SP17_9PELO|nr:hypothetical protein B9Z55_023160 [Caenorhabditis nigoni]
MRVDSELSTSCYSISIFLDLNNELHNNHFIQLNTTLHVYHNQRVYSGNLDSRLAWQSSLSMSFIFLELQFFFYCIILSSDFLFFLDISF